jgi:hypothetical protein
VGLGVLLCTPAAFVVSCIGLIRPEGRKWAIAGVLISGLLLLWFGIGVAAALKAF